MQTTPFPKYLRAEILLGQIL